MKIPSICVAVLLLASTGSTALAQAANSGKAAKPGRRAPPVPQGYTITERGPNHRVWQRYTYELTPGGTKVPKLHEVTELGSGLHYQTPDGQWVESNENIEPSPGRGGAEAIHGQHKVHFPYNIYQGVIEIVTPDGVQLKSRPLGISYFDGTNNVMIAQLTDSIGQILPSGNQVIYTNAFTEFAADLLVTYSKGGLECDLIIREQPPHPTEYGLSENSRLELYTEFFDTPEPIHGSAKVNAHSRLLDTATLEFGAMKMIQGKAFLTDDRSGERQEVPVSKNWTHLEGRTFLIEEVPFQEVEPQLRQLPAPPDENSTKQPRHASASRQLPKQRLASSSTNVVRMAKADFPNKLGFALDYDIVSSQSNYTFQADKTYYVSGTINLSGTVTIEGNTVIKCNTNAGASLNVLGTANCATAPYRPAVITSTADNTVGESSLPTTANSGSCSGTFTLTIDNEYYDLTEVYVYDDNANYVVSDSNLSSGTSRTNTFTAVPGQHFVFDAYDPWDDEYYLDFYPQQTYGLIVNHNADGDYWGPSYDNEWGGAICTPPATPTTALSLANGGALHDLRICSVAFGISSSSAYSITNIQFVNCGTALKSQSCSLVAGNVLMYNVGTAFGGQSYSVTAKQLTYDQGAHVATNSSGTCTVTLINSLLTGVTDYGTVSVSTNTVVKLSSSSGVYLSVVGGFHYLVTNSPYRGIGTNLDLALAAQLAQRTTSAPLGYTNVTFTNTQMFSLCATRDTSANPDLGYHYDPLDYVFGGCAANSNITFTTGTATGWFRTSSGYNHAGYGIHLGDNTVAAFNGAASSPNYWVRANTVQERDLSAGYGPAGMDSWVTNSNNVPICSGTFLRCSVMASEDGSHFRSETGGWLTLILSHSEIYSGRINPAVMTIGLTNCLLDRLILGPNNPNGGPTAFFMRNCTARGMVLSLVNSNGAPAYFWPFSIRDCAFDNFSLAGLTYFNTGGNPDWDYNAYTNATNPFPTGGTHDKQSVTLNWQSSWLGKYYLPTNSTLINAGSRTADAAGLYHFTTQTNQTKETNSTVDIGYHYVALNVTGNPVDTDGDGIPDYLEDANGNGIADGSETSWLLNNYNGLSSGNGLQVFTPLK